MTLLDSTVGRSLALAMTEKELQRNVRDAAEKLGWRCWCWWSSLHSPKGWPDITLIREITPERAEVICIELKSERGKVSPDQLETHRLLRLAGILTYVFRPSDWYAGRINDVLLF